MYTVISFLEKTMKFFRIHLKKFYWKIKYGNRIRIGKNFKFRSGLNINITKSGYLKIGDNCFFNNNCSVNCHKKIIIGDNNLFGESVKIYDHNHIFNDKKKNMRTSFTDNEITIGNNNWFASNVIILSKTKVGNNNVFGANTIVNAKYNSGNLVQTSPRVTITSIRYKEAADNER